MSCAQRIDCFEKSYQYIFRKISNVFLMVFVVLNLFLTDVILADLEQHC